MKKLISNTVYFIKILFKIICKYIHSKHLFIHKTSKEYCLEDRYQRQLRCSPCISPRGRDWELNSKLEYTTITYSTLCLGPCLSCSSYTVNISNCSEQVEVGQTTVYGVKNPCSRLPLSFLTYCSFCPEYI